MDQVGEADRNRWLGVINEYFLRADAGRSDILDLFADDFEFYFPKFGISTGKAAFAQFLDGFTGNVASIMHKTGEFRYIHAGNTVVVEGTTVGVLHRGGTWDGGKTPGGRFCSVFEIAGGVITRMYVYLDPDYGGADRALFLWENVDGRRW
jgi:ketosteroid isomerase-like protein